MANYQQAFDRLMQHEGGYVFDPHDAGGETFCGISRRNWPHWVGWKMIDDYKARGHKPEPNDIVLNPLVKEFYKENYWRKLGLIADQRIAYAVLDTVVKFGVRGAQAMQGILGTTRDGIIGMQTVTAINNCNQELFLRELVEWRKQKHRDIIAANPSQSRFANGWEARDNSL